MPDAAPEAGTNDVRQWHDLGGSDRELQVATDKMLAALRQMEELCVPWRFFAWRRAREAWFVAYADQQRVAATVGIPPSPMARWIRRGLAKRGLLDG